MEQQLLYQIAFTQLKGIGVINAKTLLSRFHTLEAVFNVTEKELAKTDNIGKQRAQKIIDSRSKALSRAAEELAYLKKNPSTSSYFYTDNIYPNRLKYCVDSPLMLFSLGHMNLNASRVIALVGTRKMTNYGRDLLKDFLFKLSGSNILVVSGLAYGVDTFVHKTCVDYNIPTVGVLAHGLDSLYPATNRHLAKKMMANGGLVTEYLTKTKPNRENFPSRNRVIAGLADATIIVESDRKGGSLITADIANSYGRDVFAFPGDVGKQFSSGCNALIKYQKALLIESVDDLYRQLGWQQESDQPKNRQRQLFLTLSNEESTIAKLLVKKTLTAEQISIKCKIPLSQVRTHLLTLEMNGVIRMAPGNTFTLN